MELTHSIVPGSVGVLVENMKARIVDEQGRDVPVGSPGELLLKGPNVMLGYLNNPEATHKTFSDGWLCTGDVARFFHPNSESIKLETTILLTA